MSGDNDARCASMGNKSVHSVVDEKHSFSSRTYSSKLVSNFYDLWTSEQLCDVVLQAGTYSVKAHRCVLAAASPYFQAMFTSGLVEQTKQVVVLPTLQPHILAALLAFVYTGVVEVCTSTVQDLLVAGDMLQVTEVVVICSNFLKKELNPANAVGFYRFAEAHSLNILADAVWQFIENNFPEVVLEEEFLELPLPALLRLFQSEHLKIASELQVLTAGVRWLSCESDEREAHASAVLTHVRFPVLSKSAFAAAVAECSLPSLAAAATAAQSEQMNKQTSVAPRLSARKKIYVIGGAKRELLGSYRRSEVVLEAGVCLDTFSKEWHEIPPMTIGRVMPGLAALHGKIYAVGGEVESRILANGELYDPLEDAWEHIAPMVVPRCEFGLCAHEGLLYAFGGWVGEGVGGSIERYDSATNTWDEVGTMLEPRFSMGAMEHDGLIYLVGGCTESQRQRSDLLSYNPVTSAWAVHASMPTPRSRLAVAVLDGLLYAVGGTNKNSEVLSTVERYSFTEDRWQTVAELKVGRASPAIAAANNLLYVMGGDMPSDHSDFFRTQVTIQSVEVYDPYTDTWSDHPPLPESRSEAVAAVF